MKKSVKFWVVLIALVMVVAFANSCRNDVYVTPPPSLIGTYTGMYKYVVDNGANLEVNDSQYVTVIITSTYFQMYLDTNFTVSDDRIACDAKAFYDVEQSVTLWYSDNPQDGTSRNLTAQTCSVERAPEGLFGLQQPADSVILINQTTLPGGGATKVARRIIRLVRD